MVEKIILIKIRVRQCLQTRGGVPQIVANDNDCWDAFNYMDKEAVVAGGENYCQRKENVLK